MGLARHANDCSRSFIITVGFYKRIHLLVAEDDSRHVHQLSISCILLLLCGKILAKTSVNLYELQDFGLTPLR